MTAAGLLTKVEEKEEEDHNFVQRLRGMESKRRGRGERMTNAVVDELL